MIVGGVGMKQRINWERVWKKWEQNPFSISLEESDRWLFQKLVEAELMRKK